MSTATKLRVWIRRRLRPSAPADHREAQLALQEYLDGRVDRDVAARVAQHIASCPDCTLDAETFAALKDSLHRHGTPPEDVLRRLADFADRLASGAIDEGVLTEDPEAAEDP